MICCCRPRVALLGFVLCGLIAHGTAAANSLLTAAEFATALGRATIVAANHSGAQQGREDRLRLVANLCRISNELLTIINHVDGTSKTINTMVYNGGWLTYDVVSLARQFYTEVDHAAAAKAAAEARAVDPGFECMASLLLKDILPTIEAVASMAVAATCLVKDSTEYAALCTRFQSVISLMRMLQVCLEHRHEAKARWWLIPLTAHVVLTEWELLRALPSTDATPVLPEASSVGGRVKRPSVPVLRVPPSTMTPIPEGDEKTERTTSTSSGTSSPVVFEVQPPSARGQGDSPPDSGRIEDNQENE